MRLDKLWQHTILGWFYVFFFFLPLIFTGDTSELFEFNKMWFTYAVTAMIAAAWIGKMVFKRQIRIQRTPIDIPLLLFFLSQLIATIFSLDNHVSFWGYYSRFNGGLLSTITYIFLYYALVSNIDRKNVIRLLQTSLTAGLLTALWALPSHFGYDPTCYVFRGNFDVSCWTDAFQPKVRIFGTLGQPDWLAAHLAIFIPIAMAFGLSAINKLRSKYQVVSIKYFISNKEGWAFLYYLSLTLLFYVDLLFTRARSGFIAIWVALIFFFIAVLFLQREKIKTSFILTSLYFILFVSITFFIGTSISQLDRFTYSGLNKTAPSINAQPKSKPASAVGTGEIGGTDSGKIRLLVWRGALDAWLHHPVFGTGVETFAFAYYQYRPAAHNLTSEWDYLYNKAHNEYVNYLATTGAFGLLTYLSLICWFLYQVFRHLTDQGKSENLSQKDIAKVANKQDYYRTIILGCISGYIAILAANFFGFSVVTVNLYFFLIPGFIFILNNALAPQNALLFPHAQRIELSKTSPWQYLITCIAIIAAFYTIVLLFISWQADKSYAYGMNLDRAGYYQNATQYLQQAVQMRGDEPVFKDELSNNEAILAAAAAKSDQATAKKFAEDAIQLSNTITTNYPNNIVLWKTRVRMFYSLSQLNPQYITYALDAIQKAHTLAPTDAKISYNLGLLYGQTNQVDKAISELQNTIKLKSDYRDAYYALGLMYHEAAIDTKNHIVKPDLQQKAVDEMQFILKNFSKDDKQALDALKTWGSM